MHIPLVSPPAIGWASFLVNPLVGVALLLWNALWLRQWLLAMVSIGIEWGGVWLVRTHFHANLFWFLMHLVGAALVARASTLQKELYLGHLYDGGSRLPIAPLLSLLCALQLLLLGSPSQPVTAPVAPTASQSPAPPVPHLAAGRYQQGSLAIDYRDVPIELAQSLASVLLSAGIFSEQQTGWAGLNDSPAGLQITLVLPPNATITADYESRFQATADGLASSIDPPQTVWVQVYSAERQPIKAFKSR